jgi:hypothetical protein
MPLKNLTWPSYLILLPLKQHASFQFWCHLSVAHKTYIYNWAKNYKHGSLLIIHTIITNPTLQIGFGLGRKACIMFQFNEFHIILTIEEYTNIKFLFEVREYRQ